MFYDMRKDIFNTIFDKSRGTLSERLIQIYKKVFIWENDEETEDLSENKKPDYDIEYMLKPFEGYEIINADWHKKTFTFRTPEKFNGNAQIRFTILRPKAEIWIDHVRIEDRVGRNCYQFPPP